MFSLLNLLIIAIPLKVMPDNANDRIERHT